jgi:tetratricopeptide (TPR) repeat protein
MPDAWLQLARLCQSQNLHDRTAQFLETAADQLQLQGTPLPGDFFLDLAIENAVAGKLPQAQTLAGKLADLPDAPLAALLVNELLLQEHIPISTSTAASQPKSHADEIAKRLAELAKNTTDPAALADAAGAALTVLPTLPPDTSTWIDNYAKLVNADDPTLIRLRGWLLYRQGDMAKAQAALEKSADPLAQLGLARAHLADHPALAGKILQDLWNANPTGLLALQISITARNPALRNLGYVLNDSPSAKELRPLLVRMTPALMSLHRNPQDAVYLGLALPKPSVALGEPIMLQVRMTNLLDHAVPVGPDGIVQSTVGLAAAIRGNLVTPPQQGLYAVEDLQRVYRLDSRQIMETSIRIDQGRLADIFARYPGDNLMAGIVALTAPRPLGPTDFTVGLGGQAWTVGDVQRAGIPLASPDDRQRLAQSLSTLTGLRQLVAIEAAVVYVGKKDAAAPLLLAALTPLTKSPDPLVKATLLRALPREVPANLEDAIAPLAADPDPLVRLLWARHQAQLVLPAPVPATSTAPAATAAASALVDFSNREKDPIVKDWLAATLPLLNPTTQPRK